MKEKWDGVIWKGKYSSFEDSSVDILGPGFSGEDWKNRSLNSANECLSAISSGQSIPEFYKQRTTVFPVVVSMLKTESPNKLKILDFGGSLGIGYMVLKESIPGIEERLDYNIVDVKEVCLTGSILFNDVVNIKYYEQIPKNEAFDLVYSSSTIQYVDDWKGLIKEFGGLNANYILLSDVFAGNNKSFVTLQSYYGSRIPHWMININDLLVEFDHIGYEFVMKTDVTSQRLNDQDILPMSNFDKNDRIEKTLHLLFKKKQFVK